MGRSRLIAASPMVRDSEFDAVTPCRVRLVSRWTVLPPNVRVVLASPAGSLNNLPLAVALMSPEAVVVWARSLGKRGSLRSVRVRFASRSALLVTVQRHIYLVVPLSTMPACALLLSVL